MADFPSSSGASGKWKLKAVFNAEAGNNWPAVVTDLTGEYLVAAGGGGGERDAGGGGGAGGYLAGTGQTFTLGQTYTVTVGAAGAGGTGSGAAAGSNSVLSGSGLSTQTSI